MKLPKNIIGYMWLGAGDIGIVIVEPGIGQTEPKAYIKSIEGLDMESDIIRISQYGSKFPIEEALTLLDKIGTRIK